MPGDTRKSIERTIKFVRNLNPSYAIFSLATPYPGTDFYMLDKNVNSVFIPQEVIFDPYSPNEMRDILTDRIKAGFYPDVISDEILDMLPVEELRKAKKRYPDAAVVLYVNTLAEAKAEADILCTSANAVKVVESLDEDLILFGPDMNLACA